MMGIGAAGMGALGAGIGHAVAGKYGMNRTISTLAGMFGGGAAGAVLAKLLVDKMNSKATAAPTYVPVQEFGKGTPQVGGASQPAATTGETQIRGSK